MSSKKTREVQRLLAEVRAAQQRQQRRRRVLTLAVGSVAGIAVLAALGYGIVQDRASKSTVTGDGGVPPWAAPANPLPGIRAAGLTTGPMGTADHYHVHLDVFVDGVKTPVAANIGVEPTGSMSAVHTHDDSGLIHVEAHTKGDTYTLVQVFKQWGVALTQGQIGALKVGGGKTLTSYVNGKPVSGDPAAIVVKAHDQIALAYGAPDPSFTPPASYQFAPGD